MFVPFDGTWEVIAGTLSFCNWSVLLENGLPVARVNERTGREVTLPFEPSIKPKMGFARCRCDPDAEAHDPLQRVTDYVETPIGFLVAYDSGEFGGGLSWFDESGTFRQSITGENTLRLFQTPKGILALTGLAHLFWDEGHVMRLAPAGTHWRIDKRKLPSAPRAVSVEPDGALLVATHEHVVHVGLDARVTTLHRLVKPISNFNPSSVVRANDGAIYLGGSYAVIRLRPARAGYTEDWLAPEGAQRSEQKDAGAAGW